MDPDDCYSGPSGSTTDYTPLERGAPVPTRGGPAGQPDLIQPTLSVPNPSDPTVQEEPTANDPNGTELTQALPSATNYQEYPQSDLPVPHAPSTHPRVPDPTTFSLEPPTLPNGKNIYEYDLAVMRSTGQPWRRPGSDLSQWFNYGFDEDSWGKYLGWRKGMVEGLERFKAAPGEGLTGEVADLMGLPRPAPGAPGGQLGQGGMPDGNMPSGSNDVAGANGNQAGGMNPAAMAAMGMGMGMPMNMQDGMGMGMTPEMFNQMGQMGMDGMMGMPMMPGMQGMQGMQGMDFAQMAGMMGGMGGMFGGQGQGMPPQQQQQIPPQVQQQLQGGGTPGQGGVPVKQEEGDVKAEGTPQPQITHGDQSVSCVRLVRLMARER